MVECDTMREITTTVYNVTELKEKFPKGFEAALKDWNNAPDGASTSYNYEAWEIFGSLRKFLEHTFTTGFTKDILEKFDEYYGFSGRIEEPDEYGDSKILDLSGPRAHSWLENHCLNRLRIPYGLHALKTLRRYRGGYGAGCVKPCPFTGMCFDDDILDTFVNSIKDGRTVEDSLRATLKKTFDLLEVARYDTASEEYFMDTADANDWEFTEDGKRHY